MRPEGGGSLNVFGLMSAVGKGLDVYTLGSFGGSFCLARRRFGGCVWLGLGGWLVEGRRSGLVIGLSRCGWLEAVVYEGECG